METLESICEEFRQAEKRRLRSHASRILSEKNWTAQETYHAYEETSLQMRVSEHAQTTVIVPAGWRIVLMAPKKNEEQ